MVGQNNVPEEIGMKAGANYCDNLVTELGGWKAKVNDVVGRLDKVSSGDKAKVIDQVRDLHMFIEELDHRIDGLRVECPTDWEPSQIEMETKLTEKYIY
jgi:hypothetical protein